jgi:hypothetical protein
MQPPGNGTQPIRNRFLHRFPGRMTSVRQPSKAVSGISLPYPNHAFLPNPRKNPSSMRAITLPLIAPKLIGPTTLPHPDIRTFTYCRHRDSRGKVSGVWGWSAATSGLPLVAALTTGRGAVPTGTPPSPRPSPGGWAQTRTPRARMGREPSCCCVWITPGGWLP